MDPEAALDAVFVQTLPDLQFRTCGPTFKPSTYYNCEQDVVWNCHPHIPGTATPRPGLSGLWDQMALLCPSTAYILLPSEPVNQLYGDDIELLLDVAETLKSIHETLNVDMYIVLIFKDVASCVCQQYAHFFQADFALRGYVGNLIYQSLLYDLDTPEYHLRSTHFYRYPGLNTLRQILSPATRCRVLPQQCVPALLDPASPLKVTWKGSIFSSTEEEYTGFRFLHSSNIGMPVGPVTIASCKSPGTTEANLTRTRANFIITLDVTSSENTIDLIESWRSSNVEVVLEYDEKLFIASWVPPRGYINHWHITASSMQYSPSGLFPKVRPKLPAHNHIQSGNQTPSLTVLPSDVVDLPVLSLSGMYKMSKKGKKTQSVLFGQKKSFILAKQDPTAVGKPQNLRNRSRVTKPESDMVDVDNVLVDQNKMGSSFGNEGSSIRPCTAFKSKPAPRFGSHNSRVNLQLRRKALGKIIRDKKSSTKPRLRPRIATKVDPRLVIVAMRQSFANLDLSLLKAQAEEPVHMPKNSSWSGLGRRASHFDEADCLMSNPPSTCGLSSSVHGIEYQDRDTTAEIEKAILISGTEFTNAPIKQEKMSQVFRALKELRSSFSVRV